MKKLQRGDVKVKYSTLYCQYCSAFRKSGVRDIKKLSRMCERTRKWITADTKACKKFVPSKYFWCDMYSYWLTLNECESRRLSELSSLKCKGCKRQKFQVDRVIRYSENTFAKVPKIKKLERNPKKKLKKLKRKVSPEKRVLRKITKTKRVLKRRTK